MINFTKTIENRQRQDSVWVEDKEYKIQTEFYWWIGFSKKFDDWKQEGRKEFYYEEFDHLYVIVPGNRQAGYEELCKFYHNEQPLPHPTGKQRNIKGIDWLIDSEYIYCAFLQQYGIDLIKTDLHWHDFLSLFNGLTETKINDIMSARYSEKQGKYDPMKEMRIAWQLPELDIEKPVFKMK